MHTSKYSSCEKHSPILLFSYEKECILINLARVKLLGVLPATTKFVTISFGSLRPLSQILTTRRKCSYSFFTGKRASVALAIHFLECRDGCLALNHECSPHDKILLTQFHQSSSIVVSQRIFFFLQ